MHIQLINTYSTDNVGDAAIYAALHRMCPAHAALHWSSPGAQAAGDPDAWLSVGGDIFNNARPWLVTRRYLALLRELRAGDPARTLLFGQSIPPSCRALAFHALARELRPLAAVVVRDEQSHRRLRLAGVDARLSWDTAFALTVGEPAVAAARLGFAAVGVRPDRAVLISLRGFDHMYRHSTSRMLLELASLCRLLRDRGHAPVVLLQSRVDASDGDSAVADALRAMIPDLPLIDAFGGPDTIEAWEYAAALTAIANLVVAVRFHTAVFRALAGRAAFVLHYSNKGADLARRLGLPSAPVSRFDATECLQALESTGDQLVPIEPLRTQVRRDFAAALAACGAKLRVAS